MTTKTLELAIVRQHIMLPSQSRLEGKSCIDRCHETTRCWVRHSNYIATSFNTPIFLLCLRLTNGFFFVLGNSIALDLAGGY